MQMIASTCQMGFLVIFSVDIFVSQTITLLKCLWVQRMQFSLTKQIYNLFEVI